MKPPPLAEARGGGDCQQWGESLPSCLPCRRPGATQDGLGSRCHPCPCPRSPSHGSSQPLPDCLSYRPSLSYPVARITLRPFRSALARLVLSQSPPPSAPRRHPVRRGLEVPHLGQRYCVCLAVGSACTVWPYGPTPCGFRGVKSPKTLPYCRTASTPPEISGITHSAQRGHAPTVTRLSYQRGRSGFPDQLPVRPGFPSAPCAIPDASAAIVCRIRRTLPSTPQPRL